MQDEPGTLITAPSEWGEARAARRFLSMLAIGMVAGACAAVLLVLLGMHRPPDLLDSGNSTNAYFLRAKKLAAARAIEGPRLLVLGGSSSLFGIQPDVLEPAVGKPVVNLGVQAGLGLDYILFDARRVLRRGDTALLVLEYELYLETGARSWPQADFTLRHDPQWLLTLPPARAAELIGKLTPAEWGARMLRGIVSHPVDGNAYAAVIGPRGDIVISTPEKVAERRAALDAYSSPMPFEQAHPSEFAREQLATFIAWCHAEGVEVVATYPPFMHFPEYDRGPFAAFTGEVRALYLSNQVPVVGEASDFLYPREQFFDTWYHLSRAYASTHSQRLAGLLRTTRPH